LLLYVVYTCQKLFNFILYIHLLQAKNVSWPGLIWLTLYMRITVIILLNMEMNIILFYASSTRIGKYLSIFQVD